jgi:hypothetical protein
MKRSIPNLVSHISGLGVAPLFSYFPKPAFFCQNRNVSVHFTRNFNVFNYYIFMPSAIEIVEFYPRRFSSRPVE